ncbi:MAG: aminopeptidase P family protein [Gemmatimonadaceae bacterium]|jgi:Xaa-Pro dipeptidase|nr:aminopeptidase P family protein [Gemmatimonadota bacterium]MBK7834745.1 aminopeptidase P family protein [Gemmatimonadota bacterium]MBK9408391.1 aminopeptidase P family protein [Gemmatimonadota bacterium]MCC7324071.1 aminopeptidase P family protein [Gemmatimonadaceae bacterium]HPV78079.1 Xaa-Pro peptidase family protein [Gemmatimonadaceae bacterium]
MPRLSPQSLPDIQRAIADAGLDGWLLYDFRGTNPIARDFLGFEDVHLSRRIFVLIPRVGPPVAITHNIEQGAWRGWPSSWRRERYSSWRALEAYLQEIVGGKRIAMEYSAGDAVPYLDRIPAGMLEMVRATGATVVSSGELVSRFYATWSNDDLLAHRRAAEHIAGIAHEAFLHAGSQARAGTPIAEHLLQQRMMEAFARAGLETYSPPNVSVGANAADPHYVPSADHAQVITVGNLVLIDLWAREPGRPYADQTWMAIIGAPSARAVELWNVVRDARDAAIDFLEHRIAAGHDVRGADVDDASRAVIEKAGYGEFFTHRTGHSIDAREIHGSGPNLDNLETRDERLLIPGVGFSIEPGIYFPGEIGLRTEVNGYIGDGALIITPVDIQRDLIVA